MAKTVFQANDQDLDQLASLFHVLADRIRLQILLTLVDGEKNVTSICKAVKLSQPTVSHHLSILRMNNVVDHRRAGKQVFYGIDGRICLSGKNPELTLSVQNLTVRISAR